MWAHNAAYPSDAVVRQALAIELKANGLTPTQGKQHFDAVKINRMADAMKNGLFDWKRSSLQPVIVGPNGEILGGHHRVIAAHLAGIDLASVPGSRPQIQLFPGQNFRPLHEWIDVLPDVP